MSGCVVELSNQSASSNLNNNNNNNANANANTNANANFINNSNNNNNNNNQQQQLQQQQDANNNATTSAAILARLKDVENANQQMQITVEKLQIELNNKNEIIQQLQANNKELSADKRKDMERLVETAIDDWLNSLTGISADVRKQFRDGVTRLAEQADMKNNAWEVVCNASKAHKENVNIIEQLRRDCSERDKTIETLLTSHSDPTFSSEASRIEGANKRQRVGDSNISITTRQDSAAAPPPPQQNNDAWDDFAKMLMEDGRRSYY